MALDADQREFVKLLAASERRLSAYILTLVPNLNDADEILQETHVRLWESRNRYEPGTDFVAWATRVAYYQVLTWRKRRGRQRLVFSDELVSELSSRSEAAAEQSGDRHEALLLCLSELSDGSRAVLAKVYADGQHIKDVAVAMGRTAESLYKVVQRLRTTLRNCIEQRLAEAN
ncbi:MAG: sigma-70 family RNA polymerase sigma factor [Planctomycetota bacterium]